MANESSLDFAWLLKVWCHCQGKEIECNPRCYWAGFMRHHPANIVFLEFLLSQKMLNFSNSTTYPSRKDDCAVLDFLAWNERFLTEDVCKGLMALTVTNSVVAIWTVILNALIIAVVVKNPQFRSNSKIVLACLAGNDLLTGVLTQPLQIAREVGHVLGADQYCNVDSASRAAVFFSCLTSLTLVALFSFDRYIALKYPLHYRALVTRRRLCCGVVTAYAIPVVYTFLPLLLPIIFGEALTLLVLFLDVTLACSLLSTVLCIFYMNVAVWLETRRSRKRLQALQNESSRQLETKKLKAEIAIAKTVVIVVIVLVLSYFPIIVIFATRGILMQAVQERGMYVLYNAVECILLLSALLNPIIYFWRIKQFRVAISAMLPSCKFPRNNAVENIEIQA